MWLTKLKIAIIEKDTDKLNNLLDNIPELQKQKEIEEARCLLKEATSLVHSLKDEIASSMLQIKKNIDFLESTQKQISNTLDITS